MGMVLAVVEGSAAAAGGVHAFAPALTSFVGRAAEVDEVAGLVGKYLLVTVTGLGGLAKPGWRLWWRGRWRAGSCG